MKSWLDEIPRDVTGPQLVKALRVWGYAVDRQKGSHVRITTQQEGENHEVIPNIIRSKPGPWLAFSNALPRVTV